MSTSPLPRNKILCIDALSGLARLPADSIDCVVTSPPYWALRDYGVRPLVWDARRGCRHRYGPPVRRVGVDTRSQATKVSQGTRVGNNIKTSSFTITSMGQFCQRCGAWKGSIGLEPNSRLYLAHLVQIFDAVHRVLKPRGTCWINLSDTYAGTWGTAATAKPETWVHPKNLTLIPERFAIMMAERGWILRNRIVWHKPNHMPSSVRDRFTCSWESVFLFVKSHTYYFDLDAVRVPHIRLAAHHHVAARHKSHDPLGSMRPAPEPGNPHAFAPGGKNPGDCWAIPTHPFPGAHCAVFPESLLTIPIKAGSPRGGLVLDPFMGSGTTAVAARRLGRDYLGFEPKRAFAEMARKRVKAVERAITPDQTAERCRRRVA